MLDSPNPIACPITIFNLYVDNGEQKPHRNGKSEEGISLVLITVNHFQQLQGPCKGGESHGALLCKSLVGPQAAAAAHAVPRATQKQSALWGASHQEGPGHRSHSTCGLMRCDRPPPRPPSRLQLLRSPHAPCLEHARFSKRHSYVLRVRETHAH